MKQIKILYAFASTEVYREISCASLFLLIFSVQTDGDISYPLFFLCRLTEIFPIPLCSVQTDGDISYTLFFCADWRKYFLSPFVLCRLTQIFPLPFFSVQTDGNISYPLLFYADWQRYFLSSFFLWRLTQIFPIYFFFRLTETFFFFFQKVRVVVV